MTPDEVEQLEAQVSRMRALLREVSWSGVMLDDIRMSYLPVQIDRRTWDKIVALLLEE